MNYAEVSFSRSNWIEGIYEGCGFYGAEGFRFHGLGSDETQNSFFDGAEIVVNVSTL